MWIETVFLSAVRSEFSHINITRPVLSSSCIQVMHSGVDDGKLKATSLGARRIDNEAGSLNVVVVHHEKSINASVATCCIYNYVTIINSDVCE